MNLPDDAYRSTLECCATTLAVPDNGRHLAAERDEIPQDVGTPGADADQSDGNSRH